MDSRHESLKEEFANHVIMTINTYMTNNIDTLVEDNILKNKLTDICKRIYFYLGVNVDVINILSNHNLLSTDVVVFPGVPDPEGSKILNDDEFEKLMDAIKNILNHKKKLSDNGILKKQIFTIIDEYALNNIPAAFQPRRF
jgi:hypothetical protein